MAIWHWLLIVTGTHIPPGQYSPWYNFWSGFAGDLTLFGAIFALYYKHNCHVPKCPRIARHTVDGSPYCTKHHKAARKK